MRKAFENIWIKLFFLLAATVMFFSFRAARAQDVVFTVSGPNQVTEGSQFQISFNLNDKGSGFRGPAFKGFTVLSGPNQGSSSNIQIINGSMTQSVSYTYSYYLLADKEGNFTIDPASVVVNGKTFKTNPFPIKVIKGNARQGGSVQQGGGQRQNGGGNIGSANITAKDLFVKTIVNKSEVYQGEGIVLTQKIYSRIPLLGFENIKYPSCSGFWSSEVKMPTQINMQKENINGVTYQVAELKKTILFPQKSGTLTIDPITITAVVQVRMQNFQKTGDPFFDQFFNSFPSISAQNVQKEIKSIPISIKVKPLPESGQTADFGGAVGSFSIKSELDKREVKANEPITYKVTLSGNGNIELVDKIKIDFPSDFEVYDPKIRNNISASGAGVSGSRVFEYLLVPRNQGKYKIPASNFTYFDLGRKMYVSLSLPAYDLSVGKPDGSGTLSTGIVDKEELRYLNSDIRFIKTKHPNLVSIGSFFYLSSLFWIILGLALILFIAILLIWRRYIRFISNKELVRNKRATRVARKRLNKASSYLKNKQEEAFYIELSQALWGYLSDKLNIPQSTLSMASAREGLTSHHVPQNVLDDYLNLLEECEFARFAPGDKTEKMTDLFRNAMNILTLTEKCLR